MKENEKVKSEKCRPRRRNSKKVPPLPYHLAGEGASQIGPLASTDPRLVGLGGLAGLVGLVGLVGLYGPSVCAGLGLVGLVEL